MKYSTVAYLQLEPEYWSDGSLRGIRPVRMTQRKPIEPLSGCQTVRIQVDVDESLFAIPSVSVDITLPDREVQASASAIEG